MKNTLYTIVLLVLSSFSLFAQEGEIAENFIVTDINGQTHELYAYLEEGKTVVIEFFVLWCPPCLVRFEEEVGDGVHAERGPYSVHDDIVYISIENDPNTLPEETLNGVVEFQFVEHPVVILEDDGFDQFSQFGGSGWPDVFTICPNKVINRLDNTAPVDSVIMRSIYPRVIIPNDSMLINCSMPNIDATVSNMQYNTVDFSWVEQLPSGAATNPPFDYRELNPYPTDAGKFVLAATNRLNQCGTSDTVVVTKIDQREPLLTTDNLDLIIPCGNAEDTLNIYTNGLFGGGIWSRNWSTIDGSIVKIYDSLQQHHVLIKGAGTYVTSTYDNSNGCETELEIIVSNAPYIEDVIATVNHATINQNEGSISLSPLGGTDPFLFSWSTGDTTSTIENLSAGIYGCTITDANNCPFELEVTVSGPTNTFEFGASELVKIAPNPASDHVTITVPELATQVRIHNQQGQVMQVFKKLPKGKNTLNVSGLSSGTYVLTIVLYSGKVVTKKIAVVN